MSLIASFDNTFLTLLLNPDAKPRPNPSTGNPIEHCRQRVDSLIDRISAANGRLIIPAPALAEALCLVRPPSSYVEKIQEFGCIDLVGFDAKSALVYAETIQAAKAAGDKRSGVPGDWQEIKIDRQIVAIAKAHGATEFYTDDAPQASFARMAGLKVIHTWELPLSPERAQKALYEGTEHWPNQKNPNSTSSKKPPAS